MFQIYARTHKIYTRHIQGIYKIPGGGAARSGPARRRPADRTGSGGGAPPGRARPGGLAGGYLVNILYISYIFVYIFS